MRSLVLPLLCLLCAPLYADGFREVSREGRLAEYEGRLSLSGRFERRQDAETLVWRGDRVCFLPDAAAAGQLPPPADKQDGARFFCFSNHRSATEQLRLAALPPAGYCGVAGAATVVISKYTVESGGDVFDQAWLDSVEKLGSTTPLACPKAGQ